MKMGPKFWAVILTWEHGCNVLHTACTFAQPPKRVLIAIPALCSQLGSDTSEDCNVQGQAAAEWLLSRK